MIWLLWAPLRTALLSALLLPAVRRQEDSRWSMIYSNGCTFVLQDTVD